MADLLRSAFVLVLCSIAASRADAEDLKVKLPTEEQLNPYGLTLAWWAQAQVDPTQDVVSILSVDEQNVYAQAESGIISAFGGETGRPLWSNLLGDPNMDTFPAVTNDEELLISRGLSVYSVDKISGQLRWELKLPSQPATSPEIDDERVYLGMTDGSVFAYNLRSIYNLYGEGLLPQWTQRARVWRFRGTGEIISQPISTGEVLTFGSKAGYVYGVTPKDRKLRFQFRAGSRILTPLGRSKDLVFIADDNWKLYCVNQVTGRLQWDLSASGPILKQPRVIGNQVFVSPSQDGLIALSVTSGLPIWQQTAVHEFVTASEEKVYAADNAGNLIILNRETGDIEGQIPLRHFSLHYANDRTDRIYMATPQGLVIGIRERSSEFPVYHLFPERRPILPELTPEEVPAEPAAESTESK